MKKSPDIPKIGKALVHLIRMGYVQKSFYHFYFFQDSTIKTSTLFLNLSTCSPSGTVLSLQTGELKNSIKKETYMYHEGQIGIL